MTEGNLGRVSAYAQNELKKNYSRGGVAQAYAVFAGMVGAVLKSKRLANEDRLSQIKCFYSALAEVVED